MEGLWNRCQWHLRDVVKNYLKEFLLLGGPGELSLTRKVVEENEFSKRQRVL